MVPRVLELSHDPRLQRVADFALASALLVGALIDLLRGGAGNGWSGWRPLEVAVAVGVSVPLLWRRSHPAATLWTVLVSGAVAAALVAPQQAGFEPFVALVVAYYSLGANADGRTSNLNVVGALLVSAVGGVIAVAAGEEKLGNTLPILVWTFAAWLIGRIIRSWRSRAAELEQLNHLIEEQRVVQAQAAVAVERGRIARELHDVVAHNISMIVVQAGAAARVLEGNQPEVTTALAAIEATGRQTVDEMRGLLGVLRRADDGLALAPQPGLDDLEALVNQVRDAGLAVELTIEGPTVALPAGIDLSAYRIVQEALTNSVKHADGNRARVTVRYDSTAVEIEIHDNGQAAAGKRERQRRRPRAGRYARARRPLGRRPDHRAGPDRLDRSRTAADQRRAVISVLLADDQTLVRDGFRLILNAEDDIEVVAEAGSGVEAVDEAVRHEPDLVLMDIRMPELDGIEATRRLLGALPETRVLMLTTFDLDEYVIDAFRAGASGFLLKTVPRDQLVAGVRTVYSGDALIAPASTRRLIEQFAQLTTDPRLDELTGREQEVLNCVARGLTNAEIARELVVEPSTVKSHVARVLAKLGVRDRVQAVVFAYESGLIRPGNSRPDIDRHR